MGSETKPATIQIELVTLVCDGCGARGVTSLCFDWAVDSAWDDGWRHDEGNGRVLCEKCVAKGGLSGNE